MPVLGSQAFTSPITGLTSQPVAGLGNIAALSLICAATVVGIGTNIITRVQTSLDGGITWYDIARFDFTTSTSVKRAAVDGRAQVGPVALVALASESVIHGLLGDRLRLEVTTTGTYGVGSKIDCWYSAR